MSATTDAVSLRQLVVWLEDKGYRIQRARVGEAEFEAESRITVSATAIRTGDLGIAGSINGPQGGDA